MDSKQRKLILLLKQVRIEKNIGYPEIVERCASIGQYVSLSTVKRVFAPGSEDQSFRYASIRPIVDVLLGVEYQQEEEDSASEAEALRSVVDIKNHFIAQLESDLAKRDQTIERMTEQLTIMQKHLAQKERGCRLRTIALAITITLLILAMAMLIAYLAWDLSHSDAGFFQWTAQFFDATAQAI